MYSVAMRYALGLVLATVQIAGVRAEPRSPPIGPTDAVAKHLLELGVDVGWYARFPDTQQTTETFDGLRLDVRARFGIRWGFWAGARLPIAKMIRGTEEDDRDVFIGRPILSAGWAAGTRHLTASVAFEVRAPYDESGGLEVGSENTVLDLTTPWTRGSLTIGVPLRRPASGPAHLEAFAQVAIGYGEMYEPRCSDLTENRRITEAALGLVVRFDGVTVAPAVTRLEDDSYPPRPLTGVRASAGVALDVRTTLLLGVEWARGDVAHDGSQQLFSLTTGISWSPWTTDSRGPGATTASIPVPPAARTTVVFHCN